LLKLKFKHPVFVGCIVIAGLLACLYSVSLGHNFLFDEESIILENPLLRDLSQLPQLFRYGYFYREDVTEGLWMQYYRPLTSATFLFDYAFWKLNPLGYNLTNLALFVALCLLLYRLLFRMTRNETASFFAALLFASHTIHTEAVTYIASRGDLLGSLFMVGGFLLYWESKPVAAVAFYALSLFCKESMLLMPLYFFLLDVAFFRRPFKKLALMLLPYAFVGAAFMIFRKYYCPVPMGPPELDFHAALLRFSSMGFPLLRYFEALLLPEPFRFCDEIVFAKTFMDPKVVLTAGVFGLLLYAWWKSLRARGAVFFGLSLFGLSLGPYLQIIHFYPEWAEHYFLMPLVGLTILLAVAFSRVLSSGRRALVAATAVVYVFFFGLFSLRTAQRNAAYNDTEGYYELLSESPTPFAYYGTMNLGRIYWKRQQYEKAGVFFKAALAMEKDAESNWNNLGAYYLYKKDYALAYKHFKKAYELGVADSSSLENAAVALLQMKRYEDSMSAFEAVQKKRPKTLGVYSNLMLNNELVANPRKAVRWGHKGLKAMRGRDAESALILIMIGNTAYRQGWDSLARHAARLVSERYPDVPLFGETGRMLAGDLGGDAYLEIVRSKYGSFGDEAWGYVLMARVLAGDRPGTERFLREKREEIGRSGKDAGFIRRELRRAENFVKGGL
jgi:tetratricopeptide (TPR) repeat protein